MTTKTGYVSCLTSEKAEVAAKIVAKRPEPVAIVPVRIVIVNCAADFREEKARISLDLHALRLVNHCISFVIRFNQQSYRQNRQQTLRKQAK